MIVAHFCGRPSGREPFVGGLGMQAGGAGLAVALQADHATAGWMWGYIVT